MKRNVLTLLFCMAAIVAFNTRSNAQSTLIYYWDFNSYTPLYTATTPGITIYASIDADYAVPGLVTTNSVFVDGTIPGTSALFSSYCDVVAGDTSDILNAQIIGGTLTPPGNAFRARNPDDSLELLVYMPTTGYDSLQIKYACQLSSYTSGDSVNVFSYSVDSGTTWISSGTGLSEWVDSGSVSFRLISVNVNDTNANNNRKFVFRINLVGRNNGGTSGTSGNNRFDNFTLKGSHIPGDTVIVDTALAVNKIVTVPSVYSLYPNPVGNSLDITADMDGDKTVVITNMVGQKVFTGSETGKHFTVNAAYLNSGFYFISIRESTTGSVNTMKFIKQ